MNITINKEEVLKYSKAVCVLLGVFGYNIELTPEQQNALIDILGLLIVAVYFIEGILKRTNKT